MDYPFSLTRFETSLGMAFKRSYANIRKDHVGGARVIWFVREGTLEVTRSRRSYKVSEGEWCALNGDEPKTVRLTPKARGKFSAHQAILPAHLFHSHMGGATELTEGFPIQGEEEVVVLKQLELLLAVGDRLNRQAAEYLCHAFLASIAETLHDQILELTQHQRTIDRRFFQIEDCIVKNMTNSELNHEKVAECCGISTRYLCHVMKVHGTSFSKMLWTQRLYRARDWLHAEGYRNQPIGQLALMAGFKSGAHFSRTFKKEFGMSPKVYREIAIESPGKLSHIGREQNRLAR